ncbi:hypothetical protein [Actinomadura keratinilytica]|uniref:hypothetical protein n=1 Tax=Actinomadura keratinilytica TaxID=547461 RepID=UPI0036218BCC
MVRGRAGVVVALLGLVLAAGCAQSAVQRAEPTRARDAGKRTGDPSPSASAEPEPDPDPATTPAAHENHLVPQRDEPGPSPDEEPPHRRPPASTAPCASASR